MPSHQLPASSPTKTTTTVNRNMHSEQKLLNDFLNTKRSTATNNNTNSNNININNRNNANNKTLSSRSLESNSSTNTNDTNNTNNTNATNIIHTLTPKEKSNRIETLLLSMEKESKIAGQYSDNYNRELNRKALFYRITRKYATHDSVAVIFILHMSKINIHVSTGNNNGTTTNNNNGTNNNNACGELHPKEKLYLYTKIRHLFESKIFNSNFRLVKYDDQRIFILASDPYHAMEHMKKVSHIVQHFLSVVDIPSEYSEDYTGHTSGYRHGHGHGHGHGVSDAPSPTTAKVQISGGCGYGTIFELTNDYYGDPVNVASKLAEDTAKPGEMFVSFLDVNANNNNSSGKGGKGGNGRNTNSSSSSSVSSCSSILSDTDGEYISPTKSISSKRNTKRINTKKRTNNKNNNNNKSMNNTNAKKIQIQYMKSFRSDNNSVKFTPHSVHISGVDLEYYKMEDMDMDIGASGNRNYNGNTRAIDTTGTSLRSTLKSTNSKNFNQSFMEILKVNGDADLDDDNRNNTNYLTLQSQSSLDLDHEYHTYTHTHNNNGMSGMNTPTTSTIEINDAKYEHITMLQTDLSGFTRLTKKYGILHFMTLILHCRRIFHANVLDCDMNGDGHGDKDGDVDVDVDVDDANNSYDTDYVSHTGSNTNSPLSTSNKSYKGNNRNHNHNHKHHHNHNKPHQLNYNNAEIFKYEGDNIICKFKSNDAALRYVQRVNKDIAKFNHGKNKDYQINIKFGLSVGEVLISKAGDIMGDAWEECCTLSEDMAEVGEILITKEIRDDLVQSGHGYGFNWKLEPRAATREMPMHYNLTM